MGEWDNSRMHDPAYMAERIASCEAEIAKGIVGQREIIRQVLLAMLTGGNVLLEGMPGLGKTMLVSTIGKVFDLSFKRIQFTPDLMPSDVTGTNIIIKNEKGSAFSFEQGPIFAHLILADEINRATPKTQSALLEAMQEHTVTVGNESHTLAEPFFVLATQNPIENEGTYPGVNGGKPSACYRETDGWSGITGGTYVGQSDSNCRCCAGLSAGSCNGNTCCESAYSGGRKPKSGAGVNPCVTGKGVFGRTFQCIFSGCIANGVSGSASSDYPKL